MPGSELSLPWNVEVTTLKPMLLWLPVVSVFVGKKWHKAGQMKQHGQPNVAAAG